MISKEKLLRNPNYLLSKVQAELYRQLTEFMQANKLSQKGVAKKLGVSTAYVNQILKGNFNYTIKKLIEISLLMGKAPSIKFVDIDSFWGNDRKKPKNNIVIHISSSVEGLGVHYEILENTSEYITNKKVHIDGKTVKWSKSDLSLCQN